MAPSAAAALFPPDRLAPLRVLSQLGVLLFMFVVGLRLDLGVLRGRRWAAVATSHASIAVPFALGVLLAPRLHPALAGTGVALRPFALFVGAAMSVTAFPVLARILADRGITRTRMGTIAIATAAVDDVTAWCVLAGVLAVGGAGGSLAAALTAIAAVGAYVGLVLLVGRPVLRRAFAQVPNGASYGRVALALLVAAASALATDRLGVHALFGAFLAGTAIPRHGDVARAIADRLDGPVTTLLLPIFFAFTGLRTSLGLVTAASAWGACALVLAAAVVGKVGGSAIAARATGSDWREALSIGALMNTRGLMEFVILGVGLDAGVISPTLFSMMVVMALVTTLMTAPLLSLVSATSRRVAVP
jgi:Kef-type K+ transport system membrane component KefB